MAPTSQQALDAFAVSEARRLGYRYVPERTAWMAVNDKGGQVRAAGLRPTPWEVLLAAEAAFQAGETRDAERKASRVLAALQTGAFFVRGRMDGDVVLFTAHRPGGQAIPNTADRASVVEAAVAAIQELGLGV